MNKKLFCCAGTEGYFWEETAPRLPSWNKSAPDHHWLVRAQEPLTEKCINASDDLYRNRLRALLGVDALVGEVADLIQTHGQLDQTYFIYTSGKNGAPHAVLAGGLPKSAVSVLLRLLSSSMRRVHTPSCAARCILHNTYWEALCN